MASRALVAIASLSVGLALGGIAGCDSVVPVSPDFVSERCGTYVPAEGSAKSNALTIGAVLPLHNSEGIADPRGKFRSRAIMMALEHANAENGVKQRPFKLRVCDTGGGWGASEGAAKALATWLIEHEGVQAIISGGSTDTKDIKQVSIAKGAVLMSVSGTAPGLAEGLDKDLVWRVAPSDKHQGRVLVWLAMEALKEMKAPEGEVGMLAIDNNYGNGLNDEIGKEFEGQYTLYSLKDEAASLKPALDAAEDKGVRVLVIAASAAQAAKAVKLIQNNAATYKNLNSAKLLLSDSTHNNEFLKGVDITKLGKVRGTLPGARKGLAYNSFLSQYKGRYNDGDPSQQSFTEHSYDAAFCLALAHSWALGVSGPGNVTGAALAEGLSKLSSPSKAGAGRVQLKSTTYDDLRDALLAGEDVNIQGVSGDLDFDKNGEAPSPVGIWSVGAEGKFKEEYWVEVVDLPAGSTVVVLPHG